MGQRPSRADLLRSAIHGHAGIIADETRRAPTPEIQARHRAEWPGLWRRIDELVDQLDRLDQEVGNLRRHRR